MPPLAAITYAYDFGDNIQHALTLEAVTAPELRVKYARIGGQN